MNYPKQEGKRCENFGEKGFVSLINRFSSESCKTENEARCEKQLVVRGVCVKARRKTAEINEMSFRES